MKTKLQLKTIFGDVAFEYESEGNTYKKTVEAFLIKMKDEIIKSINFSDMNLSNINFDNSSFDNSRFDNSRFDNSSFDNSRFDNSSFYKSSFYNSSFYNSSFYNSRFDNSRFDKSTMENLIKLGYDLKEYKRDLFDVLIRSIPEIPMLINSINIGEINGSVYDKSDDNTCVCLQGTLEKSERYKATYKTTLRDSARPIERFFMSIGKGDTPENSLVCKTVIDWINEFILTINPYLNK